jgi:hypothetical protein
MKALIAVPQCTTYDDPTLAALSAGRLNEIGNLSVQQAVENAGRLSAMFGVRAAQTNPIEAHAIGALNRSAAPGDSTNTSLAGALAAMLMNIAAQTPKS